MTKPKPFGRRLRFHPKIYKVTYTNKQGKRVSKDIRATHGVNAYKYVQRTFSGKNIKVKKLRNVGFANR